MANKKYLDENGLTKFWQLIKEKIPSKYASSKTAGGVADKAAAIPYGQVDSTSTATAFTATIDGITELTDGTCVLLYNGVVTSAAGFTININGLGAKPVFSNLTSATRDTTIFNVAYTMLLVYDSTRVVDSITGAWCCYRGYDSNTNTIGYQLRTNSMSMPATAKFYRYRLLFTSADNTHFVPANTSTSTNATAKRDTIQTPINPFGRIVYYGTTTAIDAEATPSVSVLWDQYTLNLGYSFNRTGTALVLQENTPVYLKCAPQSNGSVIIDASTPYVQALPSTEDGKVYILLGWAYGGAANIELTYEHPVYCYRSGQIELWTGVQNEIDALDTRVSTIESLESTWYTKPSTGIPSSDLESGIIPDVSDVIRFSSQTLTSAQQAQARTNIKSDEIFILEMEYVNGVITWITSYSDWTAAKHSYKNIILKLTDQNDADYVEYFYSHQEWLTNVGIVQLFWSFKPVTSNMVSLDGVEGRGIYFIDDISTYSTVTLANANLAPLASPVFTGTPLAPTASSATSNSQIATTSFVQDVVSNLNYYIKPSDGIGTSDLSAAVQSSLELANTALQSAPVTSVNNQTGAVTLSASDVGAAPETFAVTVTESDGDYSADKTFAEISAAYAAGKQLMAVFPIPFNYIGTEIQVLVCNPLVPAQYGANIVGFASYILDNGNGTLIYHYLGISPNGVSVSTLELNSNNTPEALGTAFAGISRKFSRSDHVHPMPSVDDIGAIAMPSSPADGAFLVYSSASSAWGAKTLASWQGGNY